MRNSILNENSLLQSHSILDFEKLCTVQIKKIVLLNLIPKPTFQITGPHQIINEAPAQIVEVEAEEEDEGYRTSPGSGNSPQSNTESPSPKVVKKQPSRSVEAMKKRKDHGGSGEESNNLMWLLDFKLDFFNESEASIKDKG